MLVDVTHLHGHHHHWVLQTGGASGWEKAAAVGTIGGAIATVIAVGSALYIGAKDRRAAEASLVRQLSASDLARRREFQLDQLLRLLEMASQLQLAHESQNAPEVKSVRRYGQARLHALPNLPLPATRSFFDESNRPAAMDIASEAVNEIAELIHRIASGEVFDG